MASNQHHCSCGEPLPPSIDAITWCQSCDRTWSIQPVMELLPVECPCCGWTGEVFNLTRRKENPDAGCPQCGSRSRHRLLHFYLQLETPIMDDPVTLLHFAPEGHLRRILRKQLNVRSITTDLHRQNVDVRADICHLPFHDGAFDMLMANHVMEHIPADAAAHRELFRVLKPGGLALLTFPWFPARATTYEDFNIVDPAERKRHFGKSDHVRKCGLDYPDRLRRAGFEVEVVRYADTFPLELERRFGIGLDAYIFRCEKPVHSPPLRPPSC